MVRDCPLCGRSNLDQPRHEFSEGEWSLKECAGCSMLYLEDVPEYEQLVEEFAWEKTFEQETEQRSRKNPTLRKLGRLPKDVLQRVTKRDKLVDWAKEYFAPGMVVDVGCAGGHTLARLPGEFVPCGIEVSKALSERARVAFAPRGGFVVCADALSGLQQCETAQFTGVIMTAFLEHEVRPLAVLEETRRVMKAGARVIIKVPNYDSWNRSLRGAKWCGFRFPDHVNYFTPETMRALVEKAGMRVLRFGLGDRMPTSDNMWLVVESKGTEERG
jgi:SAM-dependent methyltransferase